MPRRDEIDATLAKHFAWSFVPPDRTAEVGEVLRAAEASAASEPPAAPAPPPPQDEAAIEAFQARSRAACRPLAEAIASAWATADEEKRVAQVKRLLSRAHRLGVEIVGMQEWPVEAVRLLRMIALHGARLSRGQRERGASVASLMPLDHPETADLLIDVARVGDSSLADAIFADDEWTPEVGDQDALVARLADVVDDGPSHASRAVAIGSSPASSSARRRSRRSVAR